MQEAICVADACLFGFHVSMATGTYLTYAGSTAVHTVCTMHSSHIFTVKEAEGVVSDVNLCRDNS